MRANNKNTGATVSGGAAMQERRVRRGRWHV